MYKPLPINLKIFVKESNNDNPPEKTKTHRKYFPVASLTGDKAKEFYEDILKDPSLSSSKPQKLIKPKQIKPVQKPAPTKTFKKTDILWMAQNNDVENIEKYCSVYNDVNVVDEFGWTPLMCAACSGAQNAVLHLLANGADPDRSDKMGETALSLARKKNHHKIVEILEELKTQPEVDESVIEEGQIEAFFCPLCKENYEMNKSEHERSTIHLFHCRVKTSTFYGIPETNKGFQLLLREGWDREKGLGRDGTGRKYPIKAVMKKDRTGIGGTPPERPNRVETQQTENKKMKIYNRKREIDFEKNFRLEFS